MKAKLLYFILVFTFLAACEGKIFNPAQQDRSINVNGRIDGLKSRATNSTWSEGDEIGIYMIKSGQGLSAKSALAMNAKYFTQGNDVFSPVTPSDDIKFPIDESKVDFIAYYPYKEINTDFKYVVNLSDQKDQSLIDLLYSDNVKDLDLYSGAVNLNFSHQLSKIILHIRSNDQPDLTGLTASLNGVDTEGEFTLAGKSLTKSAKGIIRMSVSDDGSLAEAIILPLNDLTGAGLEISSGDLGYRYELSDAVNITEFKPGYKYIYEVTLDSKGSITINGSISDWQDGPREKITISHSFEPNPDAGSGTKEDPFTIEDVWNSTPSGKVWVKGYVVGYYVSTSLGSFSSDLSDPSKIRTSSLALSPLTHETDADKTFPIQLPQGRIRDNLNLKDNPENLGREVNVEGVVNIYYNTTGMNPVSDFEWITPLP